MLASNAGSDRAPAWWHNLKSDASASVLADGLRHDVLARDAAPAETAELWGAFAKLNPGFDEYRNLTERAIPVVILERA